MKCFSRIAWLLAGSCIGTTIVEAFPQNFICNDPRIGGGYTIMGLTPKKVSKSVLTASSTSYTAGSSVTFTVGGMSNGGAYCAIRALPKLGWLGQYGTFSDLSSKLASTGGGCPNTVYTPVVMSSGSFTWTANADTVGPVDFVVLYGSNRALSISTFTLSGPPVPNYPPVQLSAPLPLPLKSHRQQTGRVYSAANVCEAPADGSYNLPNAPVFLQKLRGKSVTLPAGECLKCREDFLDACSSALIQCPSEPGSPATQTLFQSENCTGVPISTSQLPASFVHCPGPEYYSPEYLDLSRFVPKLQRDHPSYFPNASIAEAAVSEYRRMLLVIQAYPAAPAVPSKLVDLCWHEHILDTQAYQRDSQKMFGKYLHHAPSFGDPETDEAVKAEKKEMVAQQKEMLRRYAELFGEEPRAMFWPAVGGGQMGAGRLPDCCKALCVKADCVTCVGCNAVECGKFFESDETPRRALVTQVLPSHFSGYVPFLKTFSASASVPTYLCTKTPMPGMTLSWTIYGDYIYVQQTMKKDVWHGIGFSTVSPYDMGMSDFVIAIFSGNYTGLRDLYKYDAGNHYPCWDVLTQCSVDGKAGTQDLTDRVVTRVGGVSTSSWTRLLVTPDKKDAPITSASQHVLFATGVEDAFTYHGIDSTAKYLMNFFTGTMTAA
jgi:hypothetical protein